MDVPPPVRARFFYTSPLAIDDPLSPVPPPAAAASSSRQAPRPFSEYDNDRLEEAWLNLKKDIGRHNHETGGTDTSPQPDNISLTLRNDAARADTHMGHESLAPPVDNSSWYPSGTVKRSPRELIGGDFGNTKASRAGSVASRASKETRSGADKNALDVEGLLAAEAEMPTTTGNPFIRAPSRSKIQTTSSDRDKSGSRPRPQPLDSYVWDDGLAAEPKAPQGPSARPQTSDGGPSTKVLVGVSRLHQVSMPHLDMEAVYWTPVNDIAPVVRGTWFYKETMMPVEVPVANMLELGYTELQAWTQTWQDELNSAIEVGAAGEERIVRKLWPTWPGPSAAQLSRPSTARSDSASMVKNLAVEEPDTPEIQREKAAQAARYVIHTTSSDDHIDNCSSGLAAFGRNGAARSYATAGVIYENATDAHILKSNLQPSEYYSRRPLANYIRKHRALGIPVVRGFDQSAWDLLHPPTKSSKAAKASAGASTTQAGTSPDDQHKQNPQLVPVMTPKVTDLVLVIHGIGQKLSERMESWHFTHAMNGFRREVNVELGTNEVRKKLRKNAGGIMVLPVNWRHTLSFEDGGYRVESDDPDNRYGLKDITPDTLPSVRNIVSDVMLDIPYYLSHHQPKMISAVIREANRVYSLWCRNNPDFISEGRVHIIAHSLGSVMAVDILSNQPTSLPPELRDPLTAAVDDLDHFAFKVTNLFCAGSPAGFFLLLKQAPIRPRIDTAKPGANPDSLNASVCGRKGEYGCIAVDNLYNIINPYDPVSYRMNAAVDKNYAASLKAAWLPSATPGWFSSYTSSASSTETSSAISGWFGGSARPSRPAIPDRSKSSQKSGLSVPLATPGSPELTNHANGILPRLPSNVEMDTHNFSREETAEQRMLLLNDSGQIDFLLKYGGGPLEIQYLTMLSAHSSYWLLKDFVRAVVVECGRKPGRHSVGREMRAAKKKAPGGRAG